jgi:hypothetical protein
VDSSSLPVSNRWRDYRALPAVEFSIVCRGETEKFDDDLIEVMGMIDTYQTNSPTRLFSFILGLVPNEIT